MKLFDLKSLFAPHILKRGEQYWLEEHVDCLTQQANDEITAVVEGSEDYFVRMKIRAGKVAWMECSCPYAGEGDACKHEAAVLYTLAEDGPEPVQEQAAQNIVLQELVEYMDDTAAKKIRLEFAEKDSTVAQMILQSVSAKNADAVSAETWQAQIQPQQPHCHLTMPQKIEGDRDEIQADDNDMMRIHQRQSAFPTLVLYQIVDLRHIASKQRNAITRHHLSHSPRGRGAAPARPSAFPVRAGRGALRSPTGKRLRWRCRRR